MPGDTNSTTRLAMMRAVERVQADNKLAFERTPVSVRGEMSRGLMFLSLEIVAEILERESGFRELYEALEENQWGRMGSCPDCDGYPEHGGHTLECGISRALAKVRGKQ